MAHRNHTTGRAVSALGIALMAVAGFVDVVGFLTVTGVYSAHMSGNSVGAAIAMAQHDPAKVILKMCPILIFIPGLLVGAGLVEVARRTHGRCYVAPALLVESLCLVLFILLARRAVGRPADWPTGLTLVALAAGAMGIQNGSLRRVGGLQSVHTYVTGTLVAMGEALADFLIWLGDSLHSRRPGRIRRVLRIAPQHPKLRNALFSLALWVAYIAGAMVAAFAHQRMSVGAMGIAIAALLVIVGIDVARPIRGPRGETG